ncbi:MAG: hypothetical protein LM514_02695, partial [Streptococcus sp.]|nr:hypothetical protein [Streptococcus sp.]
MFLDLSKMLRSEVFKTRPSPQRENGHKNLQALRCLEERPSSKPKLIGASFDPAIPVLRLKAEEHTHFSMSGCQ